jgi:hypothetical protein
MKEIKNNYIENGIATMYLNRFGSRSLLGLFFNSFCTVDIKPQEAIKQFKKLYNNKLVLILLIEIEKDIFTLQTEDVKHCGAVFNCVYDDIKYFEYEFKINVEVQIKYLI